MNEKVKERIKKIREDGSYDDLRSSLCDFFELGCRPDCVGCYKNEKMLEECKKYYLDRIFSVPLEVWDESFDVKVLKERQRVDLSSLDNFGVNCDTCYMYDKCPMYKKGYICAIKWGSNRPETPGEFLDYLINTQYERVQRSMAIERLDGGVADENLSKEMDRLKNMVGAKVDLSREKVSISVEATGAANSGGILQKIFGNSERKEPVYLTEKPESLGEVIDITPLPEKVKVPKKIIRYDKKQKSV